VDGVLNLGLLNPDDHRGKGVPTVLIPIVIAKQPKALGYSFVETLGCDLDRMFNTMRIATTHLAASNCHRSEAYHLRSFFASGFFGSKVPMSIPKTLPA
jgi:hypothetical protein